MNFKTILGVVFVGALIFTSCKNEAPDVEQNIEQPSVEVPTSNMPEPTESEMQEPAPAPTQEAPAMLQQNATPAPQTSQRLNPEHGQPNHRCDIAVGAPLPL